MSIRTERVGRLIQREIADLLQQDFAGSGTSLVTVTGVRMTDDLGTAYVDVSVLGTDDRQRNAAFLRLDQQATEIRHALALRVSHLRRVPDLKFFLDEGPQRRERMDELFAKIAEERTGEPEDAQDDASPSRGDY